MTKLQQVLTLLVTVMSLLVGYGKYRSDQTAALKAQEQHERDEQRKRDRDRNHLRTLEKIIVSEFPKWSPAIDWDDR